MNRREAIAGFGALAFGMAGAARAETPIPMARDFREDGRAARSARIPIVVLFSLPGCPHCEEIRRSHLAPMLRDPKQVSRAIVRQVDVNGTATLSGFAGEGISHGEVARQRGIRVAPVVQFWSPSGEEIAPPLVGALLPDFYAAYLEAGIEAASAALKAKS